MTGMEEARKLAHDIEQARRRTNAQNKAIVKIITDEGGPLWGYSDVPEGGGTVRLLAVSSDKAWEIGKTGKVTEVQPKSPR